MATVVKLCTEIHARRTVIQEKIDRKIREEKMVLRLQGFVLRAMYRMALRV